MAYILVLFIEVVWLQISGELWMAFADVPKREGCRRESCETCTAASELLGITVLMATAGLFRGGEVKVVR